MPPAKVLSFPNLVTFIRLHRINVPISWEIALFSMILPGIIFGKNFKKIMAIRVHQLRIEGDHPPLSGSLRPSRTFDCAPPPIELKMAVSEDKIKAWLMGEDPDGWERIFNIYKGNEPGPLSVQKLNKSNRRHGPIPSGLVSADKIKALLIPSKADDLTIVPVEAKESAPKQKYSKSSMERYLNSPMNKSDIRIFCLMSCRFVENQGKIELHQYFEPLTKESYCNQLWIEKHKRKWVTVDQDLLIHRVAKAVGGQEEKKLELVAESDTSEYLCMRLIYFIIAIFKKVFVFFFGNQFLADKGEPSGRLPGKKEFPKVYSVVLFTTYERKNNKERLDSQPLRAAESKSKESAPKSYIVMVPEKKESKISHSKSGILMTSDEEKVRFYFAKPSRPLPLYPELRKKIDRKIGNHPLPPETQASTSTHAEVPLPIPVQAPIEINLEAPGSDPDEYLAF